MAVRSEPWHSVAVPRNYFDGPIAETYDADPHMFDPSVVDPAVDFLADLAGPGRALELAIGTGRIGLPLRRRAWRSTGSTCPRPWWRS